MITLGFIACGLVAVACLCLMACGVVFLVGLRNHRKRRVTHKDVDRLAKKAARVRARG